MIASGMERCQRCGRAYVRDITSLTRICPLCRAKDRAVKKILSHIWKK